MADDNVTRIHPAPSIPNPLFHNPWAALTGEQLEEQMIAARARMDAAEHTLRALEREAMRREPAKRLVRDIQGTGLGPSAVPTIQIQESSDVQVVRRAGWCPRVGSCPV